MKRLTKLSLFSGILGDDLASEWAGIKTICCVEIDPFCQAVIKKHKPDMPVIGDIHDVTREKVKEVSGYDCVDIIAGGDPCQPRSVAGQRRGREDDRDLWPDMFRVICEFRPTWVVNENPTGRLTMDFHEVLSDLESQGYETRSFVIPACAVNAPHRRDRLYIVANSRRSWTKQRHGATRELLPINRGSNITTTNSRLQRPQEPEKQTVGGKECGSLVADSDGGWKQQPQRSIQESGRRIKNSSRPIDTYSNGERLQRRGIVGDCQGELTIAAESWQSDWIEVATALCGMGDGFPNRVARLKALGNAQVPQQVYPIYKAIVEAMSALSVSKGEGE